MTTITIPDSLTAEQFGCNRTYFDDHIKGKPLTVVWETAHIVKVQDSQEESWWIHKSDIKPKTDEA